MSLNFEQILAAAPSPYVVLDHELRIVWANVAYEQVTGRPLSGIRNMRMDEAFPTEDGSVSRRMLDQSLNLVLATGKVDHLPLIPYPIASSDGTIEERYWSASHTPIRDAAGKVQFILQNTEDVTRQYRGREGAGDPQDLQRRTVLRRAEAVAAENLALQDSANFLRTVLEQAPSFIALLQGPAHVFTLANAAFRQLVAQRDVVGVPAREALPEVNGQGFFELLDRAFATGEPVTVRGAAIALVSEAGAAPQRHYLDFIYQPLVGADGKATGIFVQGHDVTQQKRAEETLEKTERRFRQMAQNLPVHVWTADAEGAVDWLNDKVYEYSGLTEGDLYGPRWFDIVHSDDAARATGEWAAAARARSGYETEYRLRRHDGSYRWHLVRATPILETDAGQVRWIGSNTDIEDRRTAEAAVSELNATLEARVDDRNRELLALNDTLRQSQKLEAIGSLAGGVAHDFNNLLQTISGSLSLAAKEIDPASPAHNRMELAMTAVGRGARLASQLLSFGRRQPLAPRPTDLGVLINEQLPMLETAVGESVEVEVRVAGDLWPSSIDPANFQNAVLNILVNARDAMDRRGGVMVDLRNVVLSDSDVRLHADLRPGDYVAVRLTDNGPGIPPEIRERVLEPFFTTKAPGEGTGLGLAMVYGFVKQSGGHLAIEGGPGEGTSVVMYLPRTQQPVASRRPRLDDLPVGGGERILLVEDDEGVRTSVAMMLTGRGYSVATAADADQASVLLERGLDLDMLLTDVVMPGKLSGRDLARQARTLHPGLAVLYTSGFVHDEGYLSDGVELLSKPYSEKTLAGKVREVLALARAGQRPAPDAGAPDAAGPLAGRTILVCEDEAIIRLNLVGELEEMGASVVASGSGQRALASMKEHAFDMMIADVGLPDMSGLDLAVAVRALQPDLPVLFSTGHADLAGSRDIPRSGIVTKPYAGRQLLAAIEALLQAPGRPDPQDSPLRGGRARVTSGAQG